MSLAGSTSNLLTLSNLLQSTCSKDANCPPTFLPSRLAYRLAIDQNLRWNKINNNYIFFRSFCLLLGGLLVVAVANGTPTEKPIIDCGSPWPTHKEALKAAFAKIVGTRAQVNLMLSYQSALIPTYYQYI